MRIAIDIDNTMTNIKDKLTNAAIKYAKSLKKDLHNIDYNIVDIYIIMKISFKNYLTLIMKSLNIF